jgi:hypothetical protein
MARGGRCAPRWLAPLVAALVIGGCFLQSDDPTLESTAFEETTCPDGSVADQCFVLRAETRGTTKGQGRCDVVAVDERGADLATGASYGPLLLSPGRSYEWLVELQQVDDPAFVGWVPECGPPGTG